MKIPLVGQAYTARSLNLASQQCINLYPEISEVNQEISALYGTPGLRRLVTLPNTGGTRGGYAPASGRAIVVQGDKVYRLDGRWRYQECPGRLLTSKGAVSIADNGTTAVIVDGKYGYTLDLATSVIARITSDAFYGADRVGFIDGYFVFNKPDTQQFYISGLYNTNFDGLDFASAEGAPDLLVTLLVDHREVWMFGDTSTEVFYNSGNADFPIERIQGAFLEHGCAAPQSVAKLDNTVFWVGKDSNGSGTVWRANGYTPQRISTHAIEYALQGYSQINDAIAYTYQQDGHAFYVLTFPQAQKTWCFDVSTGAWHERAWRNTRTGEFERHRSNWLIYFGGIHVVGDWEDGRIYHLDPDCYTDDGDPLVAVRTAPVVTNSPKRLFHSCLTVEIEEGVGLQVREAQYTAATQAVFGRLAALSDTEKSKISAFVETLEVAGIWSKLDMLYVPQKSGSLANSKVDWIRGSSATLHGGITYSGANGWAGDGLGGSYADLSFIPSTDGVNFTASDASAHMYLVSNVSGDTFYFGTHGSSTYDNFYLAATLGRTELDGAANTQSSTAVPVATLAANSLVSIGAALDGGQPNINIYADGVGIGGTASSYTQALSDKSMLLFSVNANGTPFGNADSTVGMFCAGGFLTEPQMAILNTAFETYLAAP